jgi:hypothetical protein
MTRSFVGVSPCHLAEAGELVARVAFIGDPSEAFGLPFHSSRCGDRTIVGHTGEQLGLRSVSYLEPVSSAAVAGVRGAPDEVRAVELVGP